MRPQQGRQNAPILLELVLRQWSTNCVMKEPDGLVELVCHPEEVKSRDKVFLCGMSGANHNKNAETARSVCSYVSV